MDDNEYHRMHEAEERHWWYVALHDLVLHFARGERRRLDRPLAMLDAGCGTGGLGELLAPLGEVTACDIHPFALVATRARGVPHVLRRDVALDDFGEEQFDLITMMDVLYHRSVTSESLALRNMRRALRPGGLLLIQVPAFKCLYGSHDTTVHTRRRYRRREVRRMLHGAGFHSVSATCRHSALFPLAFAWRGISRVTTGLFRKAEPASDLDVRFPRMINRLLLGCARAENRLVAAGFRLPFGTSIFATARK